MAFTKFTNLDYDQIKELLKIIKSQLQLYGVWFWWLKL